ncbi:MAG TPA: acyltransferase [Anaerolineae bacterium]|nr:acyltransferase [Anaerolineae bacterium]
MLTSVGNGVYFAYGCNLSYPEVSIGEDVRIGYGTNVGLVDIGRDVRIGANCNLLSGSHMHGIERTDIPIRLQEGKLERIEIGEDCWIGANVVIMADIGEGSVVGSGSVVTKPVPAWSIVGGNPARVIRSRKPGRDDD